MAYLDAKSSLRVVVLAGGDSPEREVSLRSGVGVVAALISAGHRAVLVDPSKRSLGQIRWQRFDVCFIALHGGAGEDGRVQAQLDLLGIPYTGSGAEASRLAICKSASKARFLACGVPTLPYERIAADESAAAITRRVARLGYPLIVKPDCQGSSVGVAVARSEQELPAALEEAREHGDCIVEPLVRGREFTVAVLDGKALPMIEVVTPEGVFSYDAKYHSSLTEYRFDFSLPESLQNELVDAAVAATQALGTSGLVRVDLMLGRPAAADRDAVWVLEVNTIPGMTIRSLAPLAAARAGLDMPALCEMLVCRALIPAVA